MAARAGIEPATKRLTAACSTTELPGKKRRAKGITLADVNRENAENAAPASRAREAESVTRRSPSRPPASDQRVPQVRIGHRVFPRYRLHDEQDQPHATHGDARSRQPAEQPRREPAS